MCLDEKPSGLQGRVPHGRDALQFFRHILPFMQRSLQCLSFPALSPAKMRPIRPRMSLCADYRQEGKIERGKHDTEAEMASDSSERHLRRRNGSRLRQHLLPGDPLPGNRRYRLRRLNPASPGLEHRPSPHAPPHGIGCCLRSAPEPLRAGTDVGACRPRLCLLCPHDEHRGSRHDADALGCNPARAPRHEGVGLSCRCDRARLAGLPGPDSARARRAQGAS